MPSRVLNEEILGDVNKKVCCLSQCEDGEGKENVKTKVIFWLCLVETSGSLRGDLNRPRRRFPRARFLWVKGPYFAVPI